MTLVIAERKNDIVTFQSDSRISFGDAGYFDQGVKVFPVPIKINGPKKSLEKMDKAEFEMIYGMAVAGSAIATYSIKDSLTEILANIQYVTNLSDVSIVGIGTYVFEKYKEISTNLAQIMKGAAMSEILLGGLCIGKGRTRVIRLFPVMEKEEVKYSWEEVLIEDGIFFAGTGSNEAKKIYEEEPALTPLQIIKAVIDRKVHKSVGGYLQFGMFFPQDFKLSGIREEIIVPDSDEPAFLTHFLGFDLDKQDFTKYPKLFISHNVVSTDWRHPKMSNGSNPSIAVDSGD